MTNLITISNIQKRIAVFAMAIAMLFGMFFAAPHAHAQTDAALRAMIAELLAQISALQGQVSTEGSDVSSSVATLGDVSLGVFPEAKSVRIGSGDEAVLDVEVKSTDHDYNITTMYLALENESGSNMGKPYPWEVFESVSLWVEGNKVATIEADKQATWPYYGKEKGGEYLLPLKGLDFVLETENPVLDILVAVAVQDGVKPQTWKFGVTDMSFEAQDSDIVMQFGNPVRYDIDMVDGNLPAHLSISKSSDNPDAMTIQVDKDDQTDYVDVLVFNLAEKNGVRVGIDGISFGLDYETSGAVQVPINDVFDEATLFYKGEILAETDVLDNVFEFKNIGLELDANETKELTLALSFDGAENFGGRAEFNVSFEHIEDADDENGNTQKEITVSGGVGSEEHILTTQGLAISVIDTNASVTTVSSAATGEHAEFEMEIEVTAFGNDMFVNKYVSEKDGSIHPFVVNENRRNVDGDFTYTITSTAKEYGSSYRIEAGDSETITVTADFVPEQAGMYAMELTSFPYMIDQAKGVVYNASIDGSTEHVYVKGGSTVEIDHSDTSEDDDYGSILDMDTCPYTWSRPLTIGARGMDVKFLQKFLNLSTDTRVSVTGYGAPGNETTYFGQKLAEAVSKFQVKYRSELLSPLGFVNPTGYFGSLTMQKANELCTADSVIVVSDDNDVIEDEDSVCYSNDMVYTEGKKLSEIIIDGEVSAIADAYYVCRDGDWNVEGGLPKAKYYMKNVKNVTSRLFDPKPKKKGDEFTRYRIELTSGQVYTLKREAGTSNTKFLKQLQETGFGGTVKNFNAGVKKLTAVSGTPYYMGQIISVRMQTSRVTKERVYTIKLKNGTIRTVKRAVWMRDTQFEKALRATGFAGGMKNFTAAINSSSWSSEDLLERIAEIQEQVGQTPIPTKLPVDEEDVPVPIEELKVDEQVDEPVVDNTPQEESVDTKYYIKAIQTVNRRDFYSDVAKTKLLYRLYTIKLTNGTIHRVKRIAGTSNTKFTEQLKDAGYYGTLENFQKKINVLKPRVLGASISLDAASQLGLAIDDFESAVNAYLK